MLWTVLREKEVAMDRKKMIFARFLLSLAFVGVFATAGFARTWSTEDVYAPKYFYSYKKAIALDSSGYPHMVYGSDHLYYAYFNGTSWQYETIDDSPGTGSYASIALDGSDKVHISYCDGRLKYATNASGSWLTEIADPFSGIRTNTDIAVNSSGRVHITYLDTGGGVYNVKYATNASGSWQQEFVGGFHWHYYDTSIDVDSSDHVYICFTGSTGGLTLATRGPGGWGLQEIDAGTKPSLSVDLSDKLHIGYSYGNQIRYATNLPGEWETSSLNVSEEATRVTLAVGPSGSVHIAYKGQSTGSIKYVEYDKESQDPWSGPDDIVEGGSPSIVVDASDVLHLGYMTELALHYATNVTAGSWSWQSQTIDIRGYAGHSSLAIDRSDNVHISFATEAGLKYTTNRSGGWAIEDIDPVGGYSSIAVDFAGSVHMSYHDQEAHELKYATNASGSWVILTIDNDWQVGGRNYIAVDTTGYVHIYYYANIIGVGSFLRYATNNNKGSWSCNNVEGIDYDVVPDTIVVDSSGHAHICYFDNTHKLKYAHNTSGSWTIEELPFSTDYLKGIALDTMNYLHLAYKIGDVVMHASNAGGSWTTESVGTQGENINIAVDSFGRVHLSFLGGIQGEDHLKYAVKVHDGWEIERVDCYIGAITYEYTTGLALDSSGRAHLSYLHAFNKDLKYASSGLWVTFTVNTGDLVNRSATSIAIDSSDYAHMSYQSWSSSKRDSLGYATTKGDSWATQEVDQFMEPGQFSDVARDSSDKVHICYYEEIYRQLKYATNASRDWVTVDLENRGSATGTFCSIAVDPLDRVHISYYDADNHEVKYATNASGSWATETVEGGVDSNGGRTSIAVDPLGHAHISYNYDRHLKYATNSSGTWVSQVVDNVALVFGLTSIAVGPSGYVHISYRDATSGNEALKYATSLSGGWATEALDSSANSIGSSNSISLDTFGHVHISYNFYDGTKNELRYVSNASGSWETETVDNQGNVGQYNAIAVDSRGTVRVSYCDSTNNTLKYASRVFLGSRPVYEEDQVNDADPDWSRGCGFPPCGLKSMFQSFTPSLSTLGAVELQLRAGGSFPEIGYRTSIRLRAESPTGTVLGTGGSFVPGPLSAGDKRTVRFQFVPEIVLSPGETYIIDWECPDEGGTIITWLAAGDNPYSGGTAFGCTGAAIENGDFLFRTYAAVNTLQGEGTTLWLVDPKTQMTSVILTFEEVTQAGITGMVTSTIGPPPPSDLILGSPPTYYDVTTTALFSGEVQVCVNYSGVTYLNESLVTLLHCDNGTCVDVTTSVDTQQNIVCGTVDTLSRFVIVEPLGLEVTVDIKPEDYTNRISLKSKGVVPVAVITTPEFDAHIVDPSTVLFAGADPVRWKIKDVDKDGDADILFHFKTQDLDIDDRSVAAGLAGYTFENTYFTGVDTVNIVSNKK
jgi:hypothetical protein